jgi:hypothetical protein
MTRLVYGSGVALVLLAGAFVLTDGLVRPAPAVAPPELRLSDMEARCKRMLAMQLRVYHGTKRVAQRIEASSGKRPHFFDVLEVASLPRAQRDIVNEASRVLKVIEDEGSAVAFAEVYTQLRNDMVDIRRRLNAADVGKATRAIQKDIIDTLDEMTKALKKSVCESAP